MYRNLTILAVMFVVSFGAFGAKKVSQNLLRDGFVLSGIDGELMKVDCNNGSAKWFFKRQRKVSRATRKDEWKRSILYRVWITGRP